MYGVCVGRARKKESAEARARGRESQPSEGARGVPPGARRAAGALLGAAVARWAWRGRLVGGRARVWWGCGVRASRRAALPCLSGRRQKRSFAAVGAARRGHSRGAQRSSLCSMVLTRALCASLVPGCARGASALAWQPFQKARGCSDHRGGARPFPAPRGAWVGGSGGEATGGVSGASWEGAGGAARGPWGARRRTPAQPGSVRGHLYAVRTWLLALARQVVERGRVRVRGHRGARGASRWGARAAVVPGETARDAQLKRRRRKNAPDNLVGGARARGQAARACPLQGTGGGACGAWGGLLSARGAACAVGKRGFACLFASVCPRQGGAPPPGRGQGPRPHRAEATQSQRRLLTQRRQRRPSLRAGNARHKASSVLSRVAAAPWLFARVRLPAAPLQETRSERRPWQRRRLIIGLAGA